MLTQSLTHYTNLSKFVGPPPLTDKSDSCRNDYYDSSGEVNVKWKLKEWSIGHPEADFYRTWLNAISERLKNHFDWNLKVKTLHIEAPFIND